ncbi:MAG: hypothetical protein ISR85_07220 [Kiritimatiellales bacterium]|nr:hypothetical protein [Kiritimatiellota bacterium]MBL7012697.1 hypothetical protein [Kiritimatiellales bacterium]
MMNKEMLEILKQTTPEDFDGHTAFARMTPDQRLTWLEEANAAYLELYGRAVPELRVAEEPADYKVKGE